MQVLTRVPGLLPLGTCQKVPGSHPRHQARDPGWPHSPEMVLSSSGADAAPPPPSTGREVGVELLQLSKPGLPCKWGVGERQRPMWQVPGSAWPREPRVAVGHLLV